MSTIITLWSPAAKYDGVNWHSFIALPLGVHDGTLGRWGTEPRVRVGTRFRVTCEKSLVLLVFKMGFIVKREIENKMDIWFIGTNSYKMFPKRALWLKILPGFHKFPSQSVRVIPAAGGSRPSHQKPPSLVSPTFVNIVFFEMVSIA